MTMQFRGLTLDRFQVESIEHIDHGRSVVVSAATGTGKTIIADYIIDKSFKEGKKVFYTSPIKALSNQKFREFKALYGEGSVGILTGDVVINPMAPLLIMTTEIYRNMLLANDPITDDVYAVIFDEIHYLGDRERGTVWEEAVIFSPEHVRFLCLSATIPNARQFANWIQSITSHEVKVVSETTRAVPLEHLYFDCTTGLAELGEIKKRKQLGKYPSYRDLRGKRGRGRPSPKTRKLTHLDIVAVCKKRGWLPCIYFCFSRVSTEKKAKELADREQLLTREEQQKIRTYLDEQLEQLDPAIRGLETTRHLVHALGRGVAFHHAGILPKLKEVVEGVFAMNLLRVLYATETFAVGINLPAKAVCFDSLEKYDGTTFRYLHSKEYFQLAGRAGRRGLDKVGYAISLVDPEFADLDEVEKITAGDSEPLESQYQLSYNTILNMIASHSEKERETILLSSFYTYQQAGKHRERIIKQYRKKVARLEELEFLIDGRLTEKGNFARKVYQDELVLAELFTSSLASQFSSLQLALVCAALEFEPRPNIRFKKRPTPATKSLLKILGQYPAIASYFRETRVHFIEPLLSSWCDGAEFIDILSLTTMPEGDIIRFFRRIIDVLQQVQHATISEELKVRIEEIRKKIDRDIVEVRL